MIEDLPEFVRDSYIPARYWSEVLSKSELLVRSQYGTDRHSFVSFYYFADQDLFLCQTGMTIVTGPLLITLFARNRDEFAREIEQTPMLLRRLKFFSIESAKYAFRQTLN